MGNADEVAVRDVFHGVASGAHLLVDLVTATDAGGAKELEKVLADLAQGSPGVIQRRDYATVGPMVLWWVHLTAVSTH